jgi:hypothetical protein
MSITSYPNFVRLSSTGNGNTVAIGGTNVDAFGRLRTASPFTLFDSQNRFAIDPQFDTSTTGSGATSHLANESSVQMSVTTASGDEVIRESKRVFPYQPGKSLLVMATFVFAAQQENLRQRVGYFGANDGVYLEQNGTDVRFVVRTSTSGSADDTRYVAQSSWNIDKLDGTGPSGYTLDVTTTPSAQILFMDFEWLGVGTVRCGFVIDGQFIVCHKFHNANTLDKVYMKTAILPLRYEITATGTLSSSADMKQICSSVISEGGYQQVKALSWARMSTATTVTTSFEPLVSIRLNASSLDAVVLPAYYTVFPIPNNVDYEIALIKNPTLTGASYNTSTFNNVDLDVSATALTGGTIVLQNYTKGTNQSSGDAIVPTGYNFDLQLGRTIAGTSDVYTLAARTISGTDDIIGCLAFWDLTDGA